MMSKWQGQVLDVVALCMRAKDEGHDIFFNYLSHTCAGRQINVQIYIDGWEDGKDHIELKSYEDFEWAADNLEPCEIVETLKALIGMEWSEEEEKAI